MSVRLSVYVCMFPIANIFFWLHFCLSLSFLISITSLLTVYFFFLYPNAFHKCGFQCFQAMDPPAKPVPTLTLQMLGSGFTPVTGIVWSHSFIMCLLFNLFGAT